MNTKETNPILTVTSFDKTTPEYQLMGDFYKIFKAVYAVKDDDRFYEQATLLFHDFYEKYKDNDIAEHFDDKFLTDLTGTLGAFITRKVTRLDELKEEKEKEQQKDTDLDIAM